MAAAFMPPHTDGLVLFARWRQRTTHLIHGSLGTGHTRVLIPKGISIGLTIFAGLTIMTARQTDRRVCLCM